MQKNIIDKNGFAVTSVFVDANNNILFTNRRLEEDEQLVELNTDGNFIKPQWNGTEWIEGATEEEIKEYKEETEENPQVTEEQQLLSSVILENAEIKEQLKEQQELIATILLQNAELKGGNIDV